MPIITVDEESIQQVMHILQQGTYKKLSYEYIQGLHGLKNESTNDRMIFVMPSSDDPSIQFLVNQTQEEGQEITSANSWKFQISTDDISVGEPTYKLNLERGWNRVKEILLYHNVRYFKVVNNTAAPDTGRKDYEQGKQITIYTRYSADVNWLTLFKNITIALLLPPAIQPSVIPGNCRPFVEALLERNFFSYRNDFNPDNPHKPIDDEQSNTIAKRRGTDAYNPYSYPVPSYCDIQFQMMPKAFTFLSSALNPQIIPQMQQIDLSLKENFQQRQAEVASVAFAIDIQEEDEQRRTGICPCSCCTVL